MGDAITWPELSAKIRAAYPQAKNIPDNELFKLAQSYAASKGQKLNLKMPEQQQEQGAAGRAWEQFKNFGPTGVLSQLAPKDALDVIGLAMPEIGIPKRIYNAGKQAVDLAKQVPAAAKEFSALGENAGSMFGPPVNRNQAEVSKDLKKLGQDISSIKPEVAGMGAGLITDEALFRNLPEPAMAAAPQVADAAKSVGHGAVKAAASVSPETAYGIGAGAGMFTGHPWWGAIIARALNKAASRSLKAAPEVAKGLEVDPVTGLQLDAKVTGEQAIAAKKAAIGLEEEKPTQTLTGNDARAKLEQLRQTGGTLAASQVPKFGNFSSVKPNATTFNRAAALMPEFRPSSTRAPLALNAATHAIPEINAWSDAFNAPITGLKNLYESLPKIKQWLWDNYSSKYVEPIKNKEVDVSDIPWFADKVNPWKKGYKPITVGDLNDRIIALHQQMRGRLSDEEFSALRSEEDAVHIALNRALKSNYGDAAIMAKMGYAAVKEFQRDVYRAYGRSLTSKEGALTDTLANNKQVKPGTTRDTVIKQVFDHNKFSEDEIKRWTGAGQQQQPKSTKAPAAKPPATTGPEGEPIEPKPTPTKTGAEARATVSNATAVKTIDDAIIKLDSEVERGNISVDKYMERKDLLVKKKLELTGNPEAAKRVGVSQQLLRASEKEIASGKVKATTTVEAAKRGVQRRTAIQGEAAAQREQQLGGGRKTPKRDYETD